jgi:hypothetical protein
VAVLEFDALVHADFRCRRRRWYIRSIHPP